MNLFCDVDGTFWQHSDTDFVQYKRNIEAVKRFRAAGNIFGFATGRGRPSMLRNFPDYIENADYLVVDNGSFAVDVKKDKLIGEIVFEPSELKRIIDIATSFYPDNRMAISYHGYTQEYCFPIAPIGKVRLWLLSGSLIDPLINKISSELGSDKIKMHHERHAVKSSLSWVGSEYSAFINVMPFESGKEEAISRLVKSEKLQGETIVLGDDLNDIAMIKRFNGYAMRDSHPKLLQEVTEDHIVDSPEELIDKLLEK